MLSYSEINEILKNFDTTSYNRLQIGRNKPLVISIYSYLSSLNVSKEVLDILISNIAYLDENKVNIPLYLDILSKSLGFINDYSLKEVLDIVMDVHHIYYRECLDISLEDYLHDVNDNVLRKLYLDRNGKYLDKNFSSDSCFRYISDLKLVAAMVLDLKEYREFLGYIDEFTKYQGSYSPFKLFRFYVKLRKKLKGVTCLFWDIVYGNEYLLSLYKSNIKVSEIYKENVYNIGYKNKKISDNIQLDLFTYNDSSSYIKVNNDFKCFQICTLYNSKELLNFKQEKDLVDYYNELMSKNRKDVIVLPKLKSEVRAKYIYDVN